LPFRQAFIFWLTVDQVETACNLAACLRLIGKMLYVDHVVSERSEPAQANLKRVGYVKSSMKQPALPDWIESELSVH
jgi:hypothetical protein